MTELPEFTREQWEEYLDRLTLHAVMKYRFRGWVAKGGERIGPCSKAPQDVAYEAVLKVLNGERQYNKEVYPDFLSFLRSIVDSIVSHLANSFESRKSKPMPVAITVQEDCQEIEFEGNEPTPVSVCINKELAEKVKSVLAAEFNEDAVVKGILDCFQAGITKRAEMAELLEIDTKEIDNARKRLQRVIEKKLQNL
jgi:hypothetical protein